MPAQVTRFCNARLHFAAYRATATELRLRHKFYSCTSMHFSCISEAGVPFLLIEVGAAPQETLVFFMKALRCVKNNVDLLC